MILTIKNGQKTELSGIYAVKNGSLVSISSAYQVVQDANNTLTAKKIFGYAQGVPVPMLTAEHFEYFGDHGTIGYHTITLIADFDNSFDSSPWDEVRLQLRSTDYTGKTQFNNSGDTTEYASGWEPLKTFSGFDAVYGCATIHVRVKGIKNNVESEIREFSFNLLDRGGICSNENYNNTHHCICGKCNLGNTYVWKDNRFRCTGCDTPDNLGLVPAAFSWYREQGILSGDAEVQLSADGFDWDENLENKQITWSFRAYYDSMWSNMAGTYWDSVWYCTLPPCAKIAVTIKGNLYNETVCNKYIIPNEDWPCAYNLNDESCCNYCGEFHEHIDTDLNDECDACGAWLGPEEEECAHNYELTGRVKPTCTEAGGKIFTCSLCSDWYKESIPALGHDEIKHEAVAATCTEKGNEAYVTCSRCDYTTFKEIDALGHTEVIDAAVAATCTTAGKTEGRHCSVCNQVLTAQTEVKALDHDLTKETVAATCTENGSVSTTCSRCDYKTLETIEALGHTPRYKEGSYYVCGGGQHWHVCNVCGTTFGRDDCQMSEWEPSGSKPDKHVKYCTICDLSDTWKYEDCDYECTMDDVAQCKVCGRTANISKAPHSWTCVHNFGDPEALSYYQVCTNCSVETDPVDLELSNDFRTVYCPGCGKSYAVFV